MLCPFASPLQVVIDLLDSGIEDEALAPALAFHPGLFQDFDTEFALTE